MSPNWIVMVALNRWDLTEQALHDCLAQKIDPPPQVLLLAHEVSQDFREQLDHMVQRQPRLHAWYFTPGLPSLSASWNTLLKFVWSQGGEHALVVNNDVRLAPHTYRTLQLAREMSDGLFVSAVGRREPDMDWEPYLAGTSTGMVSFMDRGGPDYSCFLITRSCHWRFPFDEGFIPAYGEDCDHHRRLMLDGEGHRIFSVNLPYLHYASATINAEPHKAASWAARLQVSRDHYARKWGGPVNHETYAKPFDPASATEGLTNPELQRMVQELQTMPAMASLKVEPPHASDTETLGNA